MLLPSSASSVSVTVSRLPVSSMPCAVPPCPPLRLPHHLPSSSLFFTSVRVCVPICFLVWFVGGSRSRGLGSTLSCDGADTDDKGVGQDKTPPAKANEGLCQRLDRTTHQLKNHLTFRKDQGGSYWGEDLASDFTNAQGVKMKWNAWGNHKLFVSDYDQNCRSARLLTQMTDRLLSLLKGVVSHEGDVPLHVIDRLQACFSCLVSFPMTCVGMWFSAMNVPTNHVGFVD